MATGRRRKWIAANTEAILAESDHLVGGDSLGYFSELEEPPREPSNGKHYAEMRDGYVPRGNAEPKFPLVAWKDISFDAEDEWRVDGVLPSVGLGCLYGGPSALKTFIWIDLFQRMARGGLWGGRAVKQSPVVYIAAE